MSLQVNNYSYLRAKTIPALIRLCNNLNKKTGIAYKFTFENGDDGFFYAIYYGKIELQIMKPEQNKSVELDPRELIDG